MKKLLRKLLSLISAAMTLLLVAILWAWIFHLYKGSVVHPKVKTLASDPKAETVRAARKQKGVFYDQSKGQFHNIGAKLGMTVCIDVPCIAYASAGIDLDRLLIDDYKINRNLYPNYPAPNNPSSPFFVRRVRNLFTYCEINGKMMENCEKPQPGDLLLPSKVHVMMITEVFPDGTYSYIENHPDLWLTTETKGEKWRPQRVCRILAQ